MPTPGVGYRIVRGRPVGVLRTTQIRRRYVDRESVIRYGPHRVIVADVCAPLPYGRLRPTSRLCYWRRPAPAELSETESSMTLLRHAGDMEVLLPFVRRPHQLTAAFRVHPR